MPHGGPFAHGWVALLAAAAVLYAIANFRGVKRVVIGRPLRTRELHAAHNKLAWFIALPVLAADLYSSVAYGPEAGMAELSSLGPAAHWLLLPITGAVVALLVLLISSYIMGVMAYPGGGGAYSIAKDNFEGAWIRLVAASALLVDYILTVAVSVSAGVQAMASAYPRLLPYTPSLAVGCVLAILLVNLRGVSESATVFAWPTLWFMLCMVGMVGTGIFDAWRHGWVQPTTPPWGTRPSGLTTLLLLKAFSSACSALTGVETISNAVPVFRDGARGSIRAYIGLAVVTGVTLLGFALDVYIRGIGVNPHETILSQLASTYFGRGVVYQVIMWSAFLVLILAANSTFTGFPQLAALVASDRFLPRALTIRGDRLGYSNGMLVLAGLASLLIELFQAQTNALIPLYAIGVFLAFTVAQAGLLRRWLRHKPPGWAWRALVNAAGMVVTAVVLIIFCVTKFTEGAWIVLILLPLLVGICVAIRRHYDQVAQQLAIDLGFDRPRPHRVISVVLISGIQRVVLNTVQFAQSLSTDVIALYIGFDDASIERMERAWAAWGSPCRLVTIKNEYRSILDPLSQFIQLLEHSEDGRPDHIHLLIAQFIPRRWWHYLLHNQTALLIRTWMLRHKDVVVTTVPYHLQD